MKKILMFVVLSVLLSWSAAATPPHYVTDLEVSPDKGRITGHFRITIRDTGKDQEHFYIMLMLNTGEARNPHIAPVLQNGGPDGFSPTRAVISNVQINNREAAWRFKVPERPVMVNYNNDHLICEIDNTNTIPAGEELILSFDYEADLTHNKAMDDCWFKDRMVSRFSWFPYLAPADFSIDRGTFTLPFFTLQAAVSLTPGWEMAAQGGNFKQEQGECAIEYLHPVSSFPVVFLNGFTVYRKTIQAGEKNLYIYSRPGLDSTARLVASYAEDALAYYREQYFPLDYNHISIVQNGPGTYGMSSDSVVLLGDGFFAAIDRVLPRYATPLLDYVIIHELGHFYFGAGSPPDFARENYLSEGLNEYSTFKYYESKYGKWDNIFNKDQQDVMAILLDLLEPFGSESWRGNKVIDIKTAEVAGMTNPLSGEPGQKILNVAATTDYDRPYPVLNMLKNYLETAEFDQALTQYLLENRYSMVTSDSLQNSLEKYFGKDLDAFFKAFVYGKDAPDYSLTGSLNQAADGQYTSQFKVSLAGKDVMFIPTTLSVKLAGGGIEEYPVAEPGAITVVTGKPVQYAGVDLDCSLLDYDRRNNFYPRQAALELFADPWLKDDGAVLCSLPEIYLGTSTGSITLGAGLKFYENLAWNARLIPVVEIPNSIIAGQGGSILWGGLASLDLELPGYTSMGLSGQVMQTGLISYAALNFSKIFMAEENIGYVSRYLSPVLSLSASAGIADYNFLNPGNPYLYNSIALNFNRFQKTATLAALTNTTNWFLNSNSIENRTALNLSQGLALVPRCPLGLNFSCSANFGNLTLLSAANAVKGWPATTTGGLTYGAGAGAFLQFPVLNDIEYPLFNTVVLQSINSGLFYDAATAFSGFAAIAGESLANLQHSAGFEVFVTIRTLLDITLPVGLGISFNLNNISTDPTNPASYTPGIFVEIDYLANALAALSAY